ncbi:trypco2 family protein [Streptomyces sp. NPDC056411]|uniref:trypco2 family protein n=1 Tax=Streptomyces sp. NPDC056411 TaxID=3345813 RepID=UPI0035E2D301
MRVELAELIGQLRGELTRAMRDGEHEELRFEPERVELELTVAVDREAKPSGKVRFWVVEVGSEVTAASNSAQRIKLELVPRRSGRPGAAPLISGGNLPGER